jgi:hypothetical protein
MMVVLFPAMGACMGIIGKIYVFWMGHKPHKLNPNSKLCKPGGVAIYLFTHTLTDRIDFQRFYYPTVERIPRLFHGA